MIDINEMLKNKKGYVTLMISENDYQFLQQTISFLLLHEARLGNMKFTNELLDLKTRLKSGVVSN